MPDLTGSPALDVAIGLAFVFLVLSLLGTAVQEQIASWLALRASTLEKGFGTYLGSQSPFTVAFGWLLTVAAITLGAPFWFNAPRQAERARGHLKDG
jgi:branched-subunit amino acid permease